MDSDSFLSLFSNIRFLPVAVSSIIALALSGALLFLSAMISASEIAFFSLSPSDRNSIEEGEQAGDSGLLALITRSERLLATILIWNNFVNVGVVVLSSYAFNQFIDFSQAPFVGFLFETIILTFLILLCGEILPKIYAQNNPLKFARRITPAARNIMNITRPLSSFMLVSTKFVNYASKKKAIDVSADDLSKALELTSPELTDEKEMLKGIIGLYDKTAVEIMTSRVDLCDLDIRTGFHDVLKYVIETGYSRIPVYADTQDNIKGILYIKDLLPYLDRHAEFRWQSLIRPAFFVPENKQIDDLLEEFRKSKIHLAVVVDEFGGTSGIVTMEDILEEIVGDIGDEYDEEEEEKFERLPDGSLIFDAKIMLTDFFRITGIDQKIFGKLTDEVDTLAGLILEIKGDFPENEEVITYDNYSFQILEIDQKRILKVKFTKNEKNEEEKVV
ncbi:MAG: gliding motility-associated protein GldE [Dysgonamonadaceae bacterium]|jgi:gliding motility-associated protein GldE|nr:gliding motility-associated protein GldE [Dysgonamonadaceae bacterium]